MAVVQLVVRVRAVMCGHLLQLLDAVMSPSASWGQPPGTALPVPLRGSMIFVS